MSQSPELDPIVAYLEANRSTYDREQLKKQLLQDGATPDLVELALAKVYGLSIGGPVQLAVPERRKLMTHRTALTTACIIALNIVLACGPLTGLFGLDIVGNSFAIVGLGAVVAELIAAIVLFVRGKRDIGMGIILGLLIPVVLIALLWGACLILLGSSSF